MYGLECSNDYLRDMMRQEIHERQLKYKAMQEENQRWVDEKLRKERSFITKLLKMLKSSFKGKQ